MTSLIPGGDLIFLRGLAIECVIGFIDWERRVKQTVVIDLELPVDCRHAANTDEVADTLDYKKVAKRVIAFVELSEFKLVETLAHRLALLLLEEFGIEWLRSLGIKVIDLGSQECVSLLGEYIRANPEIWHEDIGQE